MGGALEAIIDTILVGNVKGSSEQNNRSTRVKVTRGRGKRDPSVSLRELVLGRFV